MKRNNELNHTGSSTNEVSFGLSDHDHEDEASTSDQTSKTKSNDDEELAKTNNDSSGTSDTPTVSSGVSDLGELNLNESNQKREKSTPSPNSISCYLCIKVNKNKDFITCPLNRKMKNRLSSEFWFQINDNW